MIEQDRRALPVRNRILTRAAITAIAAGALLLGALAYAWRTWPVVASQRGKFESVDITGVDWGKGFDLTDFNGRRRTLADFRGKVVLLFFGYTSCPDMCPTTLAKLGQAVRLLGVDANRVQGLFATLDPKRDTPQVLAHYVVAFHPAFLGLYGTENQTASAAREFKVFYQLQKANQAGFYTIDHSGPVFAFDRDGRLRLFISAEKNAESVAHDLRMLLEEAAG